MNRRFKTGANAVTFSAAVLGSVVVANLLSSRLFARLDLTEQKVFTLSKASKEVVAALPDRMTVKAFLTKQQELQYTARYVRDLLEEYATASKGKLSWQAVDPDTDAAAKQEATRMKVEPVRLQQMGAAKFSVETAFLGIGFQYGGEIESIPTVNPNSLAGLEYQITSLVKRMSQRKRKVAFSQGHGEPGFSAGLGALRGNLEQYETTTVDLKENAQIPQDVDALLIVGPQEPFDEKAKEAIDQFVMRGKSLAVLVDGMVLETPRGQMPPGQLPPQVARANDVGLSDLLKHYGASIEADMVLDEQNAVVLMQVGPGQVMPVNYPGFPIVTDIDRKNPAVKGIRGIVPVFPSSVTINEAAKSAGVEITVLARTTAKAWKQKDIFLFDPLNTPKPTEERGAYPIAVAIKGTLTSFYAGKPPAGEAAEESAPPDATPQSAAARVVVIGDSEFTRDDGLRRLRPVQGAAQANITFMVNLVDWLAQDEALIAVRSKTGTHRPLRTVEPGTISAIKYGNAVGIPVALILFGIVRWRIRRASRASAKFS
ncbi:MAG: GldG family protein [Myxococcota bacterium]